jgi:hypothetical protein
MSVNVASQPLAGTAVVTTRPIKRGTRVVVIATGVVIAAIAVAVVAGGSRWARETTAATARLEASADSAAQVVAFSGLEALPAPVQRYLKMALRDGQPRPASVRMRQTGRLRTGVESEQWLDFTASEILVPEARGFVWDARIRLAPLVHAAVRDAYIDGTGSGDVAFQSAFTLSAERGGHELNAGNLYRLLAEAPWAPTLLLPHEGLTWARVSDTRALASLTVGSETATVEFRFSDAGEVAAIYAAERPRSYGTTFVATPWEGHFDHYVTMNGIRVPKNVEVGWWIENRWVRLWQGTVEEFSFDVAGR